MGYIIIVEIYLLVVGKVVVMVVLTVVLVPVEVVVMVVLVVLVVLVDPDLLSTQPNPVS